MVWNIVEKISLMKELLLRLLKKFINYVSWIFRFYNKCCILPIQASLFWKNKFLSRHLSLINIFQEFFAKSPVALKTAISQILRGCNDQGCRKVPGKFVSWKRWLLAGFWPVGHSAKDNKRFLCNTYNHSISETHWTVYM